jgi:hypothetical protein
LRHKNLDYRFNFCEILRQISGREVAVIAIFKSSPKIKGVRPALIVAAQESSSEVFNQINPKAKTIALPKVSAGNEVLNF